MTTDTVDRDIYYMSWAMVDNLLRETALRIVRERLIFGRIVAISRGGFPVAAVLAHQLSIAAVHSLSLQQYRGQRVAADVLKRDPAFEPLLESCNNGMTLVVDDIADRGTTMAFVKDLLPSATRYAMVVKPAGAPAVHLRSFEMPQECWIHFPWEVLATPLSPRYDIA